jgi:hypothetical protein
MPPLSASWTWPGGGGVRPCSARGAAFTLKPAQPGGCLAERNGAVSDKFLSIAMLVVFFIIICTTATVSTVRRNRRARAYTRDDPITIWSPSEQVGHHHGQHGGGGGWGGGGHHDGGGGGHHGGGWGGGGGDGGSVGGHHG